MNQAAALVALLLVAGPLPARSEEGFTAPPPNLLFQLQKQNRQKPWLRVSADSARLTVRARRIDELGLAELSARGSGPPPPDLIAWRSISRIDEVRTREGRGRRLGFLLAGLAGAGLGNMIGAAHQEGGKDALLGLVVFGSLGAWQGGRLGARFERESSWYVGTPAPAETARTMPAPDGDGAPLSLAASSEFRTSPRVLATCARIGPEDLIRLRGDFGEFQGYAGVAGPRGLERLRPNHESSGQTGEITPVGLVPWSRIHRVDMRGGSAAKGAVAGGVLLGSLGGMVGAAAVSVAEGSESTSAALVEGALFGGACGALLGGLIGAAIPSWHRLYGR
jgi:hypothetical protein